jgi:chemotaxis protein CheX
MTRTLKESTLDSLPGYCDHGQPVDAEIRSDLLDQFITATQVALAEMTGKQVSPQAIYRSARYHPQGDLAVVVEMQLATEGTLVLAFPRSAAAALACQMLGSATPHVSEELVCDCLGEIANVVAGQAKAMLADTAYRFTFSLPRVMASAEFQQGSGRDRLVVEFASDLGEFSLALFVQL